jgi:hypothetical protein
MCFLCTTFCSETDKRRTLAPFRINAWNHQRDCEPMLSVSAFKGLLCIVALSIALAPLASNASTNIAIQNPIQSIAKQAAASGKGVTVWVDGQSISGLVLSFDDGYLTLRSQQFGIIVIRVSQISAIGSHVDPKR